MQRPGPCHATLKHEQSQGRCSFYYILFIFWKLLYIAKIQFQNIVTLFLIIGRMRNVVVKNSNNSSLVVVEKWTFADAVCSYWYWYISSLAPILRFNGRQWSYNIIISHNSFFYNRNGPFHNPSRLIDHLLLRIYILLHW